MNCEKWRPVVRKAEMAGNALAIHVTFRCPFCKYRSDFETKGHIINVVLRMLILEWEFEEIVKPRGCSVCGIVSTLPEKEKIELTQDIKQVITEAWLLEKAREEVPVV